MFIILSTLINSGSQLKGLCNYIKEKYIPSELIVDHSSTDSLHSFSTVLASLLRDSLIALRLKNESYILAT